MNNAIPLNQLPIGERCRVVNLEAKGVIRRRLLDLGLIYGTEVEALKQSPSGDPVAYFIRGAVIALRSDTSSTILVEKL
ncbi:FeoA family protein [Wansuia hejianensis]|uniref:FeoA family protein n=1 Tax=Wansuia hejianensis TaxID=2763667 RepID=UPI002ED273DC